MHVLCKDACMFYVINNVEGITLFYFLLYSKCWCNCRSQRVSWLFYSHVHTYITFHRGNTKSFKLNPEAEEFKLNPEAEEFNPSAVTKLPPSPTTSYNNTNSSGKRNSRGGGTGGRGNILHSNFYSSQYCMIWVLWFGFYYLHSLVHRSQIIVSHQNLGN